MGLDRNIYLEPFIKIPKQYETKKQIVKICEIHGENHEGDQFCKECGNPIIEKEVEKQYRIWYCDITGNENLWEHEDDEFVYLMNNILNVCSKYSRPDNNELLTISQKDIDNLKEEFETYHSKDIEVLKSELNIEIVIDFGLLYHVW